MAAVACCSPEQQAHIADIRVFRGLLQGACHLIHQKIADQPGLSPDHANLADWATVLPCDSVACAVATKTVPARGHHAVFHHLWHGNGGTNHEQRGGSFCWVFYLLNFIFFFCRPLETNDPFARHSIHELGVMMTRLAHASILALVLSSSRLG